MAKEQTPAPNTGQPTDRSVSSEQFNVAQQGATARFAEQYISLASKGDSAFSKSGSRDQSKSSEQSKSESTLKEMGLGDVQLVGFKGESGSATANKAVENKTSENKGVSESRQNKSLSEEAAKSASKTETSEANSQRTGREAGRDVQRASRTESRSVDGRESRENRTVSGSEDRREPRENRTESRSGDRRESPENRIASGSEDRRESRENRTESRGGDRRESRENRFESRSEDRREPRENRFESRESRTESRGEDRRDFRENRFESRSDNAGTRTDSANGNASESSSNKDTGAGRGGVNATPVSFNREGEAGNANDAARKGAASSGKSADTLHDQLHNHNRSAHENNQNHSKDHRTEHVSNHKSEHVGDHKHDHTGGHKHEHASGHKHEHTGDHKHEHAGGHKHEHTGDHKHEHAGGHKHEHTGDHKQEHGGHKQEHGGHKHEHAGGHSEDRKGEPREDRKGESREDRKGESREDRKNESSEQRKLELGQNQKSEHSPENKQEISRRELESRAELARHEGDSRGQLGHRDKQNEALHRDEVRGHSDLANAANKHQIHGNIVDRKEAGLGVDKKDISALGQSQHSESLARNSHSANVLAHGSEHKVGAHQAGHEDPAHMNSALRKGHEQGQKMGENVTGEGRKDTSLTNIFGDKNLAAPVEKQGSNFGKMLGAREEFNQQLLSAQEKQLATNKGNGQELLASADKQAGQIKQAGFVATNNPQPEISQNNTNTINNKTDIPITNVKANHESERQAVVQDNRQIDIVRHTRVSLPGDAAADDSKGSSRSTNGSGEPTSHITTTNQNGSNVVIDPQTGLPVANGNGQGGANGTGVDPTTGQGSHTGNDPNSHQHNGNTNQLPDPNTQNGTVTGVEYYPNNYVYSPFLTLGNVAFTLANLWLGLQSIQHALPFQPGFAGNYGDQPYAWSYNPHPASGWFPEQDVNSPALPNNPDYPLNAPINSLDSSWTDWNQPYNPNNANNLPGIDEGWTNIAPSGSSYIDDPHPGNYQPLPDDYYGSFPSHTHPNGLTPQQGTTDPAATDPFSASNGTNNAVASAYGNSDPVSGGSPVDFLVGSVQYNFDPPANNSANAANNNPTNPTDYWEDLWTDPNNNTQQGQTASQGDYNPWGPTGNNIANNIEGTVEQNTPQAVFDPWTDPSLQSEIGQLSTEVPALLEQSEPLDMIANLQQIAERFPNLDNIEFDGDLVKEHLLAQEEIERRENNTRREQDARRAQEKAKNDKEQHQAALLLLLEEERRRQDAKQQMYVVKQGDTLESIAASKYGSAFFAALIYRLNKNKIPIEMADGQKVYLLKAGTVLILPSRNQMRQWQTNRYSAWEEYGSNKLAPSINQSPEQESAARIRRQNIERYLGPLTPVAGNDGRMRIIVRLGDTLRSIATKHPALDDVTLWPLLAKCNGLSTDVDKHGAPLMVLRRGTWLVLPTANEIKQYKDSTKVNNKIAAPRNALKAAIEKYAVVDNLPIEESVTVRDPDKFALGAR